jgi:uncharacterized protein YraI
VPLNKAPKHSFSTINHPNPISMKTESGFTLMEAHEFTNWLNTQDVSRMVNIIQNHHTYIPAYSHFNGKNHFDRLKAMRDYHVGHNGWSDIAQNFTTFPDGTIATGRSLQTVPVGIKGHNARGICIEHLGNFDAGQDTMTEAHRNAIILINAALCQKFKLNPTIDTVVYHHWYDLNTSQRTGGSGVTKSCPGTAFFGGNKEDTALKNFIPLIISKLNELRGGAAVVEKPAIPVKFYYHVTASNLNMRTGPGTNHTQVGMIHNGSVLPVYEISDSWLKVDPADKWVAANYGLLIGQASINANVLNVRSGPGTNYQVVGSIKKGEEVFTYITDNNWVKIAISEQWVHKDYIAMKLIVPA